MEKKIIATYVILALSIIGNGYLYYTNNQSSTTNTELQSTLSDKQDTIDDLSKEITILNDGLDSQTLRNNYLQEKVEEAESVLGDLLKLQTIDRELLQKYSKVYFLNEHYRPEQMKQIDEDYVVKDEEEYVHVKVHSFLEDLMQDAKRDRIYLQIISAFRSYDEQSSLKSQYTVVYGSGANKFSADQGYSEHQLGTTVDFSTKDLGLSYEKIASTEAYEWLEENAYKYGFVLSYPPDNEYYQYEPWHWRFVGRNLAKYLHRENKNFYDLDQREIDEYLIKLFD